MVRVVVVNWNSPEWTTRCLRALGSTDYPDGKLQVVVVDNGSRDGSAGLLEERFPEVIVIRNESNLGFAEACNRAMRDLKGIDMVALVNNDAEVEPGWLWPLVEALQSDHSVGAAAAKLILQPGFARITIECENSRVAVERVSIGGTDVTRRCLYRGGETVGEPEWPLDTHHEVDREAKMFIPLVGGPSSATVTFRLVEATEAQPAVTLTGQFGSLKVDLSGGATVAEVPLDVGAETTLLNGLGTALTDELEGYDVGFGAEALDVDPGTEVAGFCGGGTLLRADSLRSAGLFDPRFFAYYEDTDLSWRLRRHGWKIVAAPESRIHHAFGAAGGARARWFFFLNYRNWLLTVLRNGSLPEIRRAFAKAFDLTSRSFRSNIASRLKHRRRPSLRLSGAWLRVWVAVGSEAPRVLWSRTRLARRPVGSLETDRVRTRLFTMPD